MLLTGLTLKTDRAEYSRHEPARSNIRVRIVPEPAADLVDETVLIALRRKGGPVIFTEQITLAGDLPKGILTAIDLTTIRDDKGIPIANRGDYQLEAYGPADSYPAGEPMATAPLRLAVITVEEMRQGYCFGAPLYSSDAPMPKRQPTVVTGVTITRLSENSRKGLVAIAFDQSANTLSWGGGPAVTIGGPKEILPDTFGGYAEVDIDEFELPAADASEGIVVDKQDLTDDFIRTEIDKAVDEVENLQLKVFLEPQSIATEPFYSEEGAHFDRKVQPLMFTRSDFNANALAWRLDLPVYQLRRVDKLVGYMGNSKAIEIHNGAMEVQPKTGEVNVLPYSSQYSYLYTFFLQLSFWGTREYIANFWRYAGIAGLTTTPGDVLKLVGYNAAMTILTVGGQGYRGGFSSESISKDGVTSSKSYTASAIYGIYSATIGEYKEWVKTNLPRLQQHYRGLSGVVL